MTQITSIRFTSAAAGLGLTRLKPLKIIDFPVLASDLLIRERILFTRLDGEGPKMDKELKIFAALAALCFAPVVASASIISFDFKTAGSGTSGAICGASCTDLKLTGTATISGLDSYFAPAATPSFSFTGLLHFAELGGSFGGIGTGAGPSGGWQLTDGAGDTLSGFFLSQLSGTPSDPTRTGGLYYGVTDGTGLFGSAWGDGTSSVTFSSFPGTYTESGHFNIAVPEPGMVSLFLAGMIGMAWTVTVRRQRRVSTQAQAA